MRGLLGARVEPTLGARAHEDHAAFVEASRRAVLDSRYDRAWIGRCPVTVEVQQPFVFEVAR